MVRMAPKNPMLRMMSLRDFRLLFVGTAFSLLGDQFTLIATPWLTLQLTGDPLALGFVLALEGIPRAMIMLFGGAITDRFSPRVIMFTADVTRFVLTCLMAFAVFTGTVQIWMLFAFSLGFGLMSGFEIPAESSIVPTLVNKHDLQAGNSFMLSTAQVGPVRGPNSSWHSDWAIFTFILRHISGLCHRRSGLRNLSDLPVAVTYW